MIYILFFQSLFHDVTIKLFLQVQIHPFIARDCSVVAYAGSFNQGAATASIKPILKTAHLIVIFERKMSVVGQKHLAREQ